MLVLKQTILICCIFPESPEFKKLEEDVAKLSAENDELKTKSEETLDKYRRSIAENDNMRKRLTKQIEDAKVYGIQGRILKFERTEKPAIYKEKNDICMIFLIV